MYFGDCFVLPSLAVVLSRSFLTYLALELWSVPFHVRVGLLVGQPLFHPTDTFQWFESPTSGCLSEPAAF